MQEDEAEGAEILMKAGLSAHVQRHSAFRKWRRGVAAIEAGTELPSMKATDIRVVGSTSLALSEETLSLLRQLTEATVRQAEGARSDTQPAGDGQVPEEDRQEVQARALRRTGQRVPRHRLGPRMDARQASQAPRSGSSRRRGAAMVNAGPGERKGHPGRCWGRRGPSPSREERGGTGGPFGAHRRDRTNGGQGVAERNQHER